MKIALTKYFSRSSQIGMLAVIALSLLIPFTYANGQNLKTYPKQNHEIHFDEHPFPFGNNPNNLDFSIPETMRFPVGELLNTFKGLDDDIYYIDSVFSYTTDQKDTKQSYSYDDEGNLLRILFQLLENGVWKNISLLTHTYDGNGKLHTQVLQTWENGAWINYQMYTTTYNSNGDRLTLLSSGWKNEIWKNSVMYFWTYDEGGNISTDITQYWQNGIWVNRGIRSYTYDATGNRLTWLGKGWENNTWVNGYLYTYSYNETGNLLKDLYQKWANGEWVNSSKIDYTYDDNGNLTTKVYQWWQGGEWEETTIIEYTYDILGNLLEEFTQHYWCIYSEEKKIEYVYNLGSNHIKAFGFEWVDDGWIPAYTYATFVIFGQRLLVVGGCEINLYYSTQTSAIDESANQKNEAFTLFPNPASQQLFVQSNQNNDCLIIIEFYNQFGEKVKTLQTGHFKPNEILNVDIGALPTGMYFVRVVSGGINTTAKIIIYN